MNTTPPLQNGLVSGLNPRRGDERRTRRWRQRPPRTPGGPRLAAPAGTVHSGKVRRNSSGAYDGCRSRPTRSRTDPQNPYQRHDGLDNMGRQSRPSIEQFGEGRVRAAIVQPPTPMFDASVVLRNDLWNGALGCNSRRLHFSNHKAFSANMLCLSRTRVGFPPLHSGGDDDLGL